MKEITFAELRKCIAMCRWTRIWNSKVSEQDLAYLKEHCDPRIYRKICWANEIMSCSQLEEILLKPNVDRGVVFYEKPVRMFFCHLTLLIFKAAKECGYLKDNEFSQTKDIVERVLERGYSKDLVEEYHQSHDFRILKNNASDGASGIRSLVEICLVAPAPLHHLANSTNPSVLPRRYNVARYFLGGRCLKKEFAGFVYLYS